MKKRIDARASDNPLMKIPLFTVLFFNGVFEQQEWLNNIRG